MSDLGPDDTDMTEAEFDGLLASSFSVAVYATRAEAEQFTAQPRMAVATASINSAPIVLINKGGAEPSLGFFGGRALEWLTGGHVDLNLGSANPR
ncbi:MAG: hypothetical protein ABSF89_16335 [Acidimicrobiales bacterium]|jgi:hypothetical protein